MSTSRKAALSARGGIDVEVRDQGLVFDHGRPPSFDLYHHTTPDKCRQGRYTRPSCGGTADYWADWNGGDGEDVCQSVLRSRLEKVNSISVPPYDI